MLTLVLAILGALVLGASYEGAVKVPGILASCTFWKLGRVGAGLWAYRPGRVYVRVGVCCG